MLDWLKAILGDHYTEEIDKQVSAEIGKGFVAKADFNTKNEDLKTANETIRTLQETVKKFDGVDVEGLKGQIKSMEREYALKEQAAGLKFSSESAKKAFLADLAAKELPIQEGKVLGFDDYVKAYKESDPGAFLSEQTPPRFSSHAEGTPAGGTAKDQANAALRAAFGNSN